VTRILTPRLNCTLHEVRAQLDASTYDGVVWNPYASVSPSLNSLASFGWVK